MTDRRQDCGLVPGRGAFAIHQILQSLQCVDAVGRSPGRFLAIPGSPPGYPPGRFLAIPRSSFGVPSRVGLLAIPSVGGASWRSRSGRSFGGATSRGGSLWGVAGKPVDHPAQAVGRAFAVGRVAVYVAARSGAIDRMALQARQLPAFGFERVTPKRCPKGYCSQGYCFQGCCFQGYY